MRRTVFQRRAFGSLSVMVPEHAANASCRLVRRRSRRPRPMADSEMADGGFSELGRQESAGARGSGAHWDSTEAPGTVARCERADERRVACWPEALRAATDRPTGGCGAEGPKRPSARRTVSTGRSRLEAIDTAPHHQNRSSGLYVTHRGIWPRKMAPRTPPARKKAVRAIPFSKRPAAAASDLRQSAICTRVGHRLPPPPPSPKPTGASRQRRARAQPPMASPWGSPLTRASTSSPISEGVLGKTADGCAVVPPRRGSVKTTILSWGCTPGYCMSPLRGWP